MGRTGFASLFQSLLWCSRNPRHGAETLAEAKAAVAIHPTQQFVDPTVQRLENAVDLCHIQQTAFAAKLIIQGCEGQQKSAASGNAPAQG